MTLKQIGRVVGLTRERVRQIERDALEGLKRGFKHVLPATYVDQRNVKHDRRVG
jgi:DNA-directed RNA polymerase sigma subunit (sigma70/sigma32)